MRQNKSFPVRPAWQMERESWIGHQRYAMEHWVHSHPTIMPCQVYPGLFSYKNVPSAKINWTANLTYGPQQKKRADGFFHPWFQLPGRLYEWNAIYGSLPPKDSWVWNFYNDTTI